MHLTLQGRELNASGRLRPTTPGDPPGAAASGAGTGQPGGPGAALAETQGVESQAGGSAGLKSPRNHLNARRAETRQPGLLPSQAGAVLRPPRRGETGRAFCPRLCRSRAGVQQFLSHVRPERWGLPASHEMLAAMRKHTLKESK